MKDQSLSNNIKILIDNLKLHPRHSQGRVTTTSGNDNDASSFKQVTDEAKQKFTGIIDDLGGIKKIIDNIANLGDLKSLDILINKLQTAGNVSNNIIKIFD